MNENAAESGVIAKNHAYAFWVNVFNIYLQHNKSGIKAQTVKCLQSDC